MEAGAFDEGTALLVNAAADLAGTKRRRRSIHVQTDVRPKVFICLQDGCGRAFSREFHLSTHMRTHTGVQVTSFARILVV